MRQIRSETGVWLSFHWRFVFASSEETLQCVCTTSTCRETGEPICLTSGLCYTQYLDRRDGSDPITKGCVKYDSITSANGWWAHLNSGRFDLVARRHCCAKIADQKVCRPRLNGQFWFAVERPCAIKLIYRSRFYPKPKNCSQVNGSGSLKLKFPTCISWHQTKSIYETNIKFDKFCLNGF